MTKWLETLQWNGSILIASIVALLGIFVTLWIHYKDNKYKQIQSRKENIIKQLVNFYVPMITYLHTSKALTRQLLSNKPKDFNLLAYLLDKDHLFDGNIKVVVSEEDLKLLDEIIILSKKIEDIIIKNGGLVEDERLNISYNPNPESTNIKLDKDNQNIGLFGLLISHYYVISYARKKVIQGNIQYYDQFKFPREIVTIIEENYLKLKQELECL